MRAAGLPAGVDLRARPIYYGEFAVGGGTSPYCDTLAKTPAAAAATPQYGTCWQYEPRMNPWKKPAVRDFMVRAFFCCLCVRVCVGVRVCVRVCV